MFEKGSKQGIQSDGHQNKPEEENRGRCYFLANAIVENLISLKKISVSATDFADIFVCIQNSRLDK